MIRCLTLLAALSTLTTAEAAAPWRPTDRFLDAVRYVESFNGVYTWGDDGQSLGDFQMSDAAWADVSAWRKARKLPTFPYRRHVLDRKINRLYAADYFSILHTELKRRTNRPPDHAELYAAYNMGVAQFAQCKFRVNRVNPVTRQKCRQILEILQGRVPPGMTLASAG